MSELSSAAPAKAATGLSTGGGGDAGSALQDVEAGHPIYTNSVDPLTENGVRALKAWMATVPAAEVNDSYIAVLDQLAAEAATARAGAEIDGSASEASAAGLGGFAAGSSAAGLAGSSTAAAQGSAASGTSGLAGMGRAFTNYLSRVVGGSGSGAEGAAAGTPGIGSGAGLGGPGVAGSSGGGGAAGGGSGSGFTGPRRSSIRMTNPLAGWAGFGDGSSSASGSARQMVSSGGSAAAAPRAGVGSGAGGGGASSVAAGASSTAGSAGSAAHGSAGAGVASGASGAPATAPAAAAPDGPGPGSLGPLGQRARAGLSPSGTSTAAAGGGAGAGLGGSGHVHGGPRRTLSRISTKISPPLSVTASASALLDRGYPDVRLSSHLLRFGPGDAEKSGSGSGSSSSSGGPASAPGGGGGDGGSSGSSASGAAAAGTAGSSAAGAGVASAAGRAPLGRRGSSTSLPDSLPPAGGRSGVAGDARSASEPRSQRNLLSGLSLLGRDKDKDGKERERDALTVPPPGSSVLVAASLSAASAAAPASGDGASSGSAGSGAAAPAAASSAAGSDRAERADRADRAYEPDPPLAPCPLNVPLVRHLAITNFSRSQAAHVTIRPLQSFVEAEAEADAGEAAYAGPGSGGTDAAASDGSSSLTLAAAAGSAAAGSAAGGDGGAGRGADSPTASGAGIGAAAAAVSAALPAGAQSLPACFISVEPSSLSLKKGASGRVAVSVTLLRPGTTVNALLAVEVAGGLRLMVMVRALAEKRVFGIPLALLPLAPLGAPGAGGVVVPPGFAAAASSGSGSVAGSIAAAGVGAVGPIGVPRTLAALRVALCRDGGLRTEGVFRMSAGGEEIASVRGALDAGVFDGAASPCSPLAAAQLIKVFLRELMPSKVLASLPTEPLLAVVTPEQCAALADAHLPAGSPLRCLLDWLVDCLAETAEQEVSNRMGAKALAVCVAPNLLDTDVSNAAINPMTALMCSQKTVHMLAKLVERRLAARAAAARSGSGSTGSSADGGAPHASAVGAPRASAAVLADVRASAKVPMASAAAIAAVGAGLSGGRPLPAPAPLSADSAASGAGESFNASSASGQNGAASLGHADGAAASAAAGHSEGGDHDCGNDVDADAEAAPPRSRVLPEDRWSCDISLDSSAASALHAARAASEAAEASRPLPAAPPRSDE